MPAAAPRPCRAPGCRELVRDPVARGYCDAHADRRSNWQARQQRTGTTTARGYGAAWRKIRQRIMERDGGLCQPCLRLGFTVLAYAVDHIVNKARDGTDADDNLQAICRECHKAKTAREGAQG